MNKLYFRLVFIVFNFSFASQCMSATLPIISSDKSKSKNSMAKNISCSDEAIEGGVNKAIQVEFQKKVLIDLQLSKANLEEQKLWGLFSSGGWSGGGQFFVVENKKSGELQLYHRAAGKRDVSKHVISSEKAASFKVNIEALNEISHLCKTVFDAINYEIIVAGFKQNGEFLIKKTILMQAPHVDPASTKHIAIVKAFESLIPTIN